MTMLFMVYPSILLLPRQVIKVSRLSLDGEGEQPGVGTGTFLDAPSV